MEDHAEDLRALLDHLEIDGCHLIGTSYGGEVGLIFAYTFPERVKSLSVISSVSEIEPDLDRVVDLWARTALEAPNDLYRVSAPSNFSRNFIEKNQQVIDQGEARIRACPPDFFTGFANLVEVFRRLDITDSLSRIECPTLVLVGEEDAIKRSRYSHLLAERIPDSEFLVVPEAGHAVIIEKPNEVNTAVLGFLVKHG
jgi:3-oxoadipate enol-lactonase